MKKTYLAVLIIALGAILVPTMVFATEPMVEDGDDLLSTIGEQGLHTEDPNDGSGSNQTYITVLGKWGEGKDHDFDGFFGGRITRKGRFGVFVGAYNKTGEEERTRIVGIMKQGYFNGKIISDDCEYRVTALYSIGTENDLIKMQWMVKGQGGWAIGRIDVTSQ